MSAAKKKKKKKKKKINRNFGIKKSECGNLHSKIGMVGRYAVWHCLELIVNVCGIPMAIVIYTGETSCPFIVIDFPIRIFRWMSLKII